MFLTFLELGYFLFVFLSSLGGLLGLYEVSLFLPQGRQFALERRVLLLGCLKRLFQRVEFRFEGQHFLAGGGIVSLTGAGRQESGQRKAGR